MSPYRVKYRQGLKKITLFRNLLAKLVFEKVGIDEIIVIFDLFDQLIVESETKEDFDRKYGAWLITCYALLNQINPQVYPFSMTSGQRAEWAENLKPLLPSHRALSSWAGNPINHDPFRVIIDLQLKVRKPSSFKIGKGYTDKGTARNPATDGTPRWQEVAGSDIIREQKVGVVSFNPMDAHVVLKQKVDAAKKVGLLNRLTSVSVTRRE